MLVLTLKPDERIVLLTTQGPVDLRLVDLKQGRMRLGIQAPSEIAILGPRLAADLAPASNRVPAVATVGVAAVATGGGGVAAGGGGVRHESCPACGREMTTNAMVHTCLNCGVSVGDTPAATARIALELARQLCRQIATDPAPPHDLGARVAAITRGLVVVVRQLDDRAVAAIDNASPITPGAKP